MMLGCSCCSCLMLAWITAAATALRSASRMWLRDWVEQQLTGKVTAEAISSDCTSCSRRPERRRALLAILAGLAIGTRPRSDVLGIRSRSSSSRLPCSCSGSSYRAPSRVAGRRGSCRCCCQRCVPRRRCCRRWSGSRSAVAAACVRSGRERAVPARGLRGAAARGTARGHRRARGDRDHHRCGAVRRARAARRDDAAHGCLRGGYCARRRSRWPR